MMIFICHCPWGKLNFPTLVNLYIVQLYSAFHDENQRDLNFFLVKLNDDEDELWIWIALYCLTNCASVISSWCTVRRNHSSSICSFQGLGTSRSTDEPEE